MKLGTEVGLGPGHITLDGDPDPPPKKKWRHNPCLLWPYGWMSKIPLGTEVGLGPGDIVLDGDLAPPQKGGRCTHNFCAGLLWSNGWMNQDET